MRRYEPHQQQHQQHHQQPRQQQQQEEQYQRPMQQQQHRPRQQQQQQVPAPTAGDFLKARLVRSQQQQAAQKKQAELQRKADQRLKLEKRKMRILEQKQRMKDQQARSALLKRTKAQTTKTSLTQVFSLEDETDPDESHSSSSQTVSSSSATATSSTSAQESSQSSSKQPPSSPRKSKWDQADPTGQAALVAAQLRIAQQVASKLAAQPVQRDADGQVIPPAPSDQGIIKAIHNLVDFVLKNGVQFEEVVRSRNKDVKSFRFLFDMLSPEYTYYKWKLRQSQKEKEEAETAAMVKRARGGSAAPMMGHVPGQGMAPSAPPGVQDGPLMMSGQPMIGGHVDAPWNNQNQMPQQPPQDQQYGHHQHHQQLQQHHHPLPHAQNFDGGRGYDDPQRDEHNEDEDRARRRRARRSKWDEVTAPEDAEKQSAQYATDDDQSLAFDRLDEQETTKASKEQRSTQSDGSISYNAAPPPAVLATSTSAQSSTSSRKHHFSVLERRSRSRSRSRTRSRSRSRSRSQSQSRSRSRSRSPAKRRRFSERPTGDTSNRSELDSVAQMNWFAKQADQREQRLYVAPPEEDKTVDPKKDHAGHHIGDFIPAEELEKFNAQSSGKKFVSNQNKISSDNKGHQLLKKMGWSEGTRLGANSDGAAGPIGSHMQKWQNQGVGAGHQGDVGQDDDPFETYKKKMMLSYRFRPNPLNNPRKAYY